MDQLHIIASAWRWNPLVISGCLFLLALYAVIVRFRFSSRAILFVFGIVLLFLALASPLNVLSNTYLFSAHAIQDLLLLQIAPAFLILGIPASVAARIRERAPIFARVIRNPAIGWLAANAVMIAWHVPAMFNASLRDPRTSAAEHLSYLVAGALFWWPVFAPLKSERMAPVPWSALYLIGACIPCSLLGLALTFAHVGPYVSYYSPHDVLGILPVIRETWGLSLEVDQETGGFFLWVGGCMIYTSAVMGLFTMWYNSPEVRNEFASKAAQQS